jgi:SAM-dependent methyltransferase
VSINGSASAGTGIDGETPLPGSLLKTGMKTSRFQDFFHEKTYLSLKNSLYNYRLRKLAVGAVMRQDRTGIALEVGSGISPVMPRGRRTIYSDLSYTAMAALRREDLSRHCVVADAMNLPFKPGAFSHTVASEVLEHLEDDRAALDELTRVLADAGRLILTFPHRQAYFAEDDRFVAHLRRYEMPRMRDLILNAGLRPVVWQKVLGPLEKVTMWAAVLVYARMVPDRMPLGRGRLSGGVLRSWFVWVNLVYTALAWMDARLAPRSLAAVLLVAAERPDTPKQATRKGRALRFLQHTFG